MLNLIVFIQSFPCMFVGFNLTVECKSLVRLAKNNEVHDLLATDSRVDNLRKVT